MSDDCAVDVALCKELLKLMVESTLRWLLLLNKSLYMAKFDDVCKHPARTN